MMIGKALALTAVLTGGTATVWLASGDTLEAKFIAACEDTIKDRLRSPSTYQRVSVSELRRSTATLDQYMGDTVPELRDFARDMEQSDPNYAKARDQLRRIFEAVPHDFIAVSIGYDAQNGFGVPIRSVVECSDTIQAGSDGGPMMLEPAIDGYTTMAWLAAQIRAGN